MRADTEIFKRKIMVSLGPEYEVLGEYVNNRTKIKMKHLKCEHEWECLPMTLTRKKPTRCPNCFGTPKKTHEKFVQEVKDLVGDEYSVLGLYKGGKEKIKTLENRLSEQEKPENHSSKNSHRKECNDYRKL